jgi:hypothetical protein
MSFVSFMRSTNGRLLRVVAGVVLILVGLAAVGGTGGVIIAIIGVVPLLAGIFNFCLFGPLFGVGLRGGGHARHS